MAWIEPRGKSWIVIWREDGRRHSKGGFTSKRDARVFQNDIERRILTGTLGAAEERKQPFGVYATNLFQADASLRAITRENRLRTIRLYLEPRLGQFTIEELQPARVRAALASVNEEKGPWITEQCHRVLSRVVKQALADGLIHRNLLDGYRLPEMERRPIRILTPEQVNAVAGEIVPHLRALVLVSAWGGLRAGELGALKPDDLDFERNTVRVDEAVSHPKAGPVIGPPKTKTSRRVVTLPGWVMKELAEHMLHMPTAETIFVKPQGGLVTSKDLNHYWRLACERVGLTPVPRFHDVRHTHVAILIRQGAHPKMIQSRMGHASITETMDTYGHLFPGTDAELAAGLEEFKPEMGKVIEL